MKNQKLKNLVKVVCGTTTNVDDACMPHPKNILQR
jgi:hypothetical protein